MPLLCCLVLGFALVPDRAEAQKKDKAKMAAAKAAFKAGRGFLKEGKHGEAVASFRKAYEITQDGRVMGQVAMTCEKAGDYECALKAIKIYKDSLPKARQGSASKMIAKYEREIKAGKSKPLAIPSDKKPVEAKPVEAKPVEAKPVEAKPVEAKPVEAKPVEAKPVEAKPVEAKPVEAKPVEAKPEEGEGEGEGDGEGVDVGEGEEEEKPERFYTWIAAGSAAALALSGLVVGLNAQSKYDELMDRCAGVGPGCTDSEVDSIETRAMVADVLFGVAGAAAITAGVLYFLEGRSDEKEPEKKNDSASMRKRIRVSPVAGQGTYGLTGSIKF